jgi:lipooligosaccharide transport system permease protein
VIDVSVVAASRYWHRNAVVFKRTWLVGLMAWFIEPVIYLVAMGTGLGAYLRTIGGITYIDFIAPGLLAVSAMWGATFEATWGAYYKLDRAGVYEAVAATPLSVEDVAVGEILWATTRATIYGSAFAVVATPFGVFKSWWGLLTIPALVLVGAWFAIAGLAFAYWVRRMDYLAYYWTIFLTPMFMFAGVFFPLQRLPSWVQTLAWFMPLHHAAELMRSLMANGDPVAAAGSALWLLATSVALFPLPLVLLRRRLVQ